MGEILEMQPEAEPVQNLDSRKERVLASYCCIQQCVARESKISMERGWECAAIERENGWELVGFKHQHACRVHLGVSYANWYRTMAIAEKFSQLDKSEFMVMKLGNAELLSRHESEVRYSQDNIDKAGSLSLEAFKTHLAPNGAVPEPIDDKPATFELKMSKGKKDAIETGLREFQMQHQLDTTSYALELLVCEYKDRPTLAGFIAESIPRLGVEIAKAKTYDELLALKGIFALHIKEMSDLLQMCCGEEKVA